MSPELYMRVAGWLTLSGFVGLLYILSWQWRVKPSDFQQWSALVFILSFAIILGQLCIAYLGGPSLGSGIRGLASYAFLMVSIIVLASETRRHNLKVLRRQRERERRVRMID